MKTIRRCPIAFAGWVLGASATMSVYAGDKPTTTLSFAVSTLDPAGYYDPKGADCPHGYNLHPIDYYPLELKRLGYSPQEIAELMKLPPQHELHNKLTSIMLVRGRDQNGNPVNIFHHPESEPDPHVYTVEGRYGFGFNLDNLDKPDDFTDPNTQEKGIDNNWYKVLGCFDSLKWQKDGVRPSYFAQTSTVSLEERPAYLIEVAGIHDLENDENVQVTLMASLDPLSRGPDGDAAHDRTMRIDPDPQWHNTVRGHIKNGVLETEVFDVNEPGEPLFVAQVLHLRKGRLRLNLRPTSNDTYKGLLGGYMKWRMLSWTLNRGAQLSETSFSINVPGYYYALKRLADADPDPKTGENTSISTAFDVTAVRAILVKSPALATR